MGSRRFRLQPLAEDASALLAIDGPVLWEAVIDHVVALDAGRALDDLGVTVPSPQPETIPARDKTCRAQPMYSERGDPFNICV
jgi:hypothetical protein